VATAPLRQAADGPVVERLSAAPPHPARIALFVAAVVVGAALASWLAAVMREAAVSTSGSALPDYLTATLLALVLGALLLVIPIPELDRTSLFLLWTVKAAVTVFVLPVYEAHYAVLDARTYYAVGALGTAAMPPLAFGAGTNVTIWLIHWVTRGLPAYFHLLEMLWSFIGLLAIYAFYRGWRWLVWWLDARFLLWIGLFPSILFWSSILGKDPPVLLGIGLYFYGVAKWCATRRARLLAVAILGVLIASAIRPWLALVLLVPLAAFPLSRRGQRGWQRLGLAVGVAVGAFLAGRAFLLRFQITDVQDLVQVSNTLAHGWAHGGSAVRLPEIGNVPSMLRFLPLGMFTALFRPLPGEVGGAFGWASGLVNAVLLLAALLGFAPGWLRVSALPWLKWVVLLILAWAAMYAVPSSQNLGTAVRFAVQIQLVLWPLILILGSSGGARWVLGIAGAGRLGMRGGPVEPGATLTAPSKGRSSP
jgi:hypothetical protein